ncbi:hypothetical protein TNCV_1568211 [Trichonephila clavipes]|nr:hypothetical protein TNCV_1568211 [Trichonephila clavipes]
MANNQSVRRHLDAAPRSNHWEVEANRSVGAEFRNCSQHRFILWRQFQTTGTAIRGFSSGRPREPHPQMNTLSYKEETGGRQREKSLHTTQATGRPISRLPWPEDCTVVVCLHDALYGVYL